jgi:hypothetical protein
MSLRETITVQELRAEGVKFLEAGHNYLKAAWKADMGGMAVIWVEDTQGGLVIYTRGEYRNTILSNIQQVGRVISFGIADDGVVQ